MFHESERVDNMKNGSLACILKELLAGKIDAISCDPTVPNFKKIVSVLGIDLQRGTAIEFDESNNVAYAHSYPSPYGVFKIECFGTHRNCVAPIYVERISH